MAERLNTWAELCHRAGIDPGKTAANAPVTKLISAGIVNTGPSVDSVAQNCDSSAPCCGGGMCELN